MKISIRSKVFLYLFLFLGIGAGAYAVLSSRLFRSVVVPLNRELNESSVKWLGSLFENQLDQYSQVIHQWANHTGTSLPDADSLAISLYVNEPGSADWKKTLSAGTKDFVRNGDIPFAQIISRKKFIFHSSKMDQVPFLSLGIHLENSAPENRIVILDFKPDPFLKLFRDREFSETYLVGLDGGVILHRDPEVFTSRPNWSDHPIIREAAEPGQVLSRAFNWKGTRYSASAWTLSNYPVKVVSQVNDDRLQEPVRVLGVKTLIFFAWIAATALLLAFYLTRLLTEQERTASKAIEEARFQVNQTQDEASLASEKNELEILREITKGWRMSYQVSGWDGLIKDLKRPVNGFNSLLEEDLANLEVITEGQLKRHEARAKMARQVRLDLTRASEILEVGKEEAENGQKS